MSAKILEGRELAKKRIAVSGEIIKRLQSSGKTISLATIMVGKPKDACAYSGAIDRLVEKAGIKVIHKNFDESITEDQLALELQKLNKDDSVTGVMIFSPLPKQITSNIFQYLDMWKDVEGRTFLKNAKGVFSPTGKAVMALLDEAMPSLEGKKAVVVGHSDLVGKPIATLLLDKFATVTVCHAKTKDLRQHLAEADIVVVAVGKAGLIGGDWLKEGAAVIDVGENFVDGKIVGDVEFVSASKKAAFLSPVPGGVGPLTNSMLIENLVELKSFQEQLKSLWK